MARRKGEPLEHLTPTSTRLLAALPIVVALLAVVASLGWASALVLRGSALSDGAFVFIGAYALASAMAGLFAGGWALHRWRRDGSTVLGRKRS